MDTKDIKNLDEGYYAEESEDTEAEEEESK